MQPTYQTREDAWVSISGRPETGLDALGVERPPSLARKLVEASLYITAVNSTFSLQTGAFLLPYVGGAAVLLAGAIGFAVMVMQRERMPVSVWFALLMNIAATLSQGMNGEMPVFGDGLRVYLFWLCQLIMVCYLVKNEATFFRVLVFYSLLVLVSVWMGGVAVGGYGKGRLTLEYIGSGFANPNGLAYLSGILIIAMLFGILRKSWPAHPFWWLPATTVAIGLSGLLLIVLLRTISRGGILTFAGGLSVFFLAVLLARGARLRGAMVLALMVAGLLVVSVTEYIGALSHPIELLESRLGQKSVRERVYDWHTLDDIWKTMVIGVGPSRAVVRSAGIQAHNSFLFTHMAFGGLTAWIYVAWIFVLLVRSVRMLRAHEVPMDIKLKVVALLLMSLSCQFLTNQGFMFEPSTLAIAITEKYTAPFTRKRIAERRASQVVSSMQPQLYAAYGGLTYTT